MTKGAVATLDEGRLRQLIQVLGERFDWDVPAAGFAEVGRWESRTSILYKLENSGRFPTVVLKVGKEWTIAKAREVFEDLTELRELFEGSGKVKAKVPRVFGWHDTPPCVCIAFVDGEDLSRVLGRKEGYGSERVRSAMAECGAALGLFHTSALVDPGSGSAGLDLDQLSRRLTVMARRVGVDPSFMDSMDLSHVVSRRYGDFAPYNMRMTDDGSLWILDQPSTHSYAPVHRDVAYFMERVERRLGVDEPDEELSLATGQLQLEQAVLDSYAVTGPSALNTPEDRMLLAVYQSHKHSRTALKRLKQGRFNEIPGFLRRAMRARARARIGPDSPTEG